MTQYAMEFKETATNRVYGRIEYKRLVSLAAEGQISLDDLVRSAGSQRWQPVSDFPELAARLAGDGEGSDELPDRVLEDLGGIDRGWRAKLQRRQDDQEPIQMIPMIDVTFQLLIFFMLTSAMASSAAIEVPEAVYGRGVSPEGRQFVLVDQKGTYYLGEVLDEENRADSLESLVREVGNNGAKVGGGMEVIVNAHKESEFAHVRQLVERLATVPDLGPIRVGVEERQ